MTRFRYVFSEEASVLTDEEYATCLRWVETIRRCITVFEAGTRSSLFERQAHWSRVGRPTTEIDGALVNQYTSADLLLSGDRDILRKMRLYAQSFSGYQLATQEAAGEP